MSDRRVNVDRMFVIIGTLVREEWRLHARLFGGWRFLLVPAVIAVAAAGGARALIVADTSAGSIVLGVHLFAIGFGLYAGTAGFAGSDMLEDLFGELSFLLATTETLPLSRRLLLGLFLLKDAGYYGLLFVLPMAVAGVGVVGLSLSTPFVVGALWLSLWLAFVAGMAATVTAIALRTRGVPSLAILGGVILIVLLIRHAEVSGTMVSMLVTEGRGPVASLALATAVAAVGAFALALYDPSHEPPTRTSAERFGRLEDQLPTSDPLVVKSVLDLGRSSGGFAKPLVSVGILFALVAGLVGVVESITGLAPAPGIFFGGVLGLSAFTTYNWLTQVDDVEGYGALPVSIEAVFRAKRDAFVLVGAPTVALPYVLAVIWFDATRLDALAGAAIAAGYSLYYYGLTVAVAGFSPNEFLFDGLRFATFSIAVAAVLVPTLVVGFAVVPPTSSVVIALVVASVCLGALGRSLSQWAGTHWSSRYRAGTVR